jgi:hypothetical protein
MFCDLHFQAEADFASDCRIRDCYGTLGTFGGLAPRDSSPDRRTALALVISILACSAPMVSATPRYITFGRIPMMISLMV